MDSKPEHLEHDRGNALSTDELAHNGGLSADNRSRDSNRPGELSGRKSSPQHHDEGKDYEYGFEEHADDDLLHDNGEGLPASEESEPGVQQSQSDEHEARDEVQPSSDDVADEQQDAHESEHDEDAKSDEEECQGVIEPELDQDEPEEEPQQEDEESEEEEVEPEPESKSENDDAEGGSEAVERKQSFIAEIREEESHRMEEEDVDHGRHEELSEPERDDSPQSKEALSEEQEQPAEPEPEQQDEAESIPEQIEQEEEEQEQPKLPVKKQPRGRKGKGKGKRATSAEPQLAKRPTPPTAKPEDEVSVLSDRGVYAKEHELRHLGKEIHRSTTTVVYVAETPIDATHFGQCLIKQRLPARRKISARPSAEAIRQEVASLAKAKNMGVPVPAVYAVNVAQRLLCLEYFKNTSTLREYLAAKADSYDDDTIVEMRKLFTTLGSHIAEMHNGNIVHGGLSVDSVLLDKSKLALRLISFGASTTSGSIEEKAADLYALVRSFPATAEEHMRYNDLTHCVFTGYTAKSAKLDSVVQRVQKIKQKLLGQAR